MRSIFALLVSLGCVSICDAVPITFIHEGSGSGTLGGTPFGNTSFVITGQGDTTNRLTQSSGIFFIDHTSAQINLSGIGTFAFTSGTRTFVNQGTPIVGFSRSGPTGADLFNGPTNAVYASWDMLTGIGPHSGSGDLIQWGTDVTTQGGPLVFNSASTQATFTARIVPEPSAAVLVLVAALGWGIWYRTARAARR